MDSWQNIEELAGQAEQLQDTIAFFKVEDATRKMTPSENKESEMPQEASAKEDKARVKDSEERGESKKSETNGHDSSGDYLINMKDTGDDRDAELERY